MQIIVSHRLLSRKDKPKVHGTGDGPQADRLHLPQGDRLASASCVKVARSIT